MQAKLARESSLYAELVRRGLPAEYARRTAEELEDHRADLMSDLRAAGAADPEGAAAERLGETGELARRIAADYQRRSWFGRWPLINFLLAPIPILIAAFLIGYLPIAVVGVALEAFTTSRPSVLMQSVLGHAALLWMFVIVPALVAYGWGRVALIKTGNRAYVLSVSCVLAMFVGASFCAELRPSPIPGEGKLLVSSPAFIGDSNGSIILLQHPKQLPQYAAPLLAGVVLIYRDQRRRRAALLAEPPEENRMLAA